MERSHESISAEIYLRVNEDLHSTRLHHRREMRELYVSLEL